MFLRMLNWLFKFFGYTLLAKAERKPLPLLEISEVPCSNVILVDFSRGARKQLFFVQPTAADAADDVLEISIKIPPRIHARMNAIKRVTGVASHVETVRRALSTYDSLVKLNAEGRAIGFYDQQENWVELDLKFD
jgi:hypothetical protein